MARTTPAVTAEGLGKYYRIGYAQRYKTIRESLAGLVLRRGRPRAHRRGVGEQAAGEGGVWALRDVSFEVSSGEVVGIIGRNGAGKSTLLKILGRITEPTEGRAVIRGRVGTLLEVGTGFHPELTGRENVFLSGAVLGMSRGEIQRKFDEIVAFAEVERFIDTPVKRFSTGMFMRLAFSVAAHLDSEILLVDEVLAVGDAAFQKRCIGKMDEVARGGRTVLFVSHNMGAIRSLCGRCIVLEGGRVRHEGSVETGLDVYRSLMSQPTDEPAELGRFDLTDRPRRRDAGVTQLRWLQLVDGSGRGRRTFDFGDGLRIRIGFAASERVRLGAHVLVKSPSEERLALLSTMFDGVEMEADGPDNVIEVRVPHLPLATGRYALEVLLFIPHVEVLEHVEYAGDFEIDLSHPGDAGLAYEQRLGLGYVYIDHEWKVGRAALPAE